MPLPSDRRSAPRPVRRTYLSLRNVKNPYTASNARMIHSQARSCFVRTRQGKTVIAVVLTLLLLLPLQLLAQSSASRQGAGSLRFLVISDWGGKGGTTQVAVAQQMGRAAAAQKSSFVITCGDNYHGSGIASANSPSWKTEYEDIYSNPSPMIDR